MAEGVVADRQILTKNRIIPGFSIVEEFDQGSFADALEFSLTTIASCILAAIFGRMLGRIVESWWVRRHPDALEGGA